MAHVHFCDVAGHEWKCDKPTCICICGKVMNDGDHSECPVELKACPEHVSGIAEGEVVGGLPIGIPKDAEAKIEKALEQLETYEAACLWCGHGYDDYDRNAEYQHLALHCSHAPEELREHAKRRLCGNGAEQKGHEEAN